MEPGGSEAITGLGLAWTGLVVVQGSRLGWMDEGRFRLLARLPVPGMRLVARSDGVGLLLFGGSEGDGRSLLLVLQDGSYERLVESYAPITGVAERNGDIVFAVSEDLFALPLAGDPVLLYRHPEPIVSMTADPRSSVLFLASPSGVFALHSSGPASVLGGATGFLHHDGDHLFVSAPYLREVLALSTSPTRSPMTPPARLRPQGSRPTRTEPVELSGPFEMKFLK